MFKKLRIKLTFFNMVVFGGILVIFSLMILLSGNYKEADRNIQEMWTIAMKNDLFKIPNKDLSNKEDMIYVKLDQQKNIVEENYPDNFSSSDIEQMTAKVLENMQYNGQIKYKDKEYLFLKIILDNDEGSIFAFKEYSQKLSYDKAFAVRAIFYITIYLILGFLGSLFMSGKALIPIKSAWQRQIDFTADASHELRTPLAVIQTNIELIMDNGKETVESQKKWLNNILLENKRMSKLVNELLTLSRADAKKYKAQKENLMLDKLLAEVMVHFELIAQSNNITLSTSGEKKVEFYGNKNDLKQLFIILIDNALKYGGDNGHINVDLMKYDKCIRIVISDNGAGIEPENINKIFDRFYRGDKARAVNREGAGLGLSIAKNIVEQNNGTIRVESVLGKGTSFIITLPCNNYPNKNRTNYTK